MLGLFAATEECGRRGPASRRVPGLGMTGRPTRRWPCGPREAPRAPSRAGSSAAPARPARRSVPDPVPRTVGRLVGCRRAPDTCLADPNRATGQVGGASWDDEQADQALVDVECDPAHPLAGLALPDRDDHDLAADSAGLGDRGAVGHDDGGLGAAHQVARGDDSRRPGVEDQVAGADRPPLAAVCQPEGEVARPSTRRLVRPGTSIPNRLTSPFIRPLTCAAPHALTEDGLRPYET